MPIQQHPLPQDISSYRFRLIGDMTIRQFIYIAVFIILTVLTHNSPIPFFFRYPLEVFFLGLGIGLAFIPVQGRPLDQWIIAFIKSIYSPTQYVWKQSPVDPIKTTSQKTPLPPHPTESPQNPDGLSISTTVIDHQLPTTDSPSIQTPTPSFQPSSSQPRSNSKIASSILKKSVKKTPKPLTSDQDKPITSPTTPPPVSLVAPPSAPTKSSSNKDAQRSSTSGRDKPPSTQLPIPFTPEQPNTLVGLTLNSSNKILEGVLIEIISNNLTIRATKSNKLGQFLFAKSLENGLYQIKAEKEGFKFDTYSINLKGGIVKPLKLQAK